MRKGKGIIVILLLALLLCCAFSCEGGEYCDSGQHYEWRCSDELGTCVAVCVE